MTIDANTILRIADAVEGQGGDASDIADLVTVWGEIQTRNEEKMLNQFNIKRPENHE